MNICFAYLAGSICVNFKRVVSSLNLSRSQRLEKQLTSFRNERSPLRVQPVGIIGMGKVSGIRTSDFYY
jgi:hypothetical protein